MYSHFIDREDRVNHNEFLCCPDFNFAVSTILSSQIAFIGKELLMSIFTFLQSGDKYYVQHAIRDSGDKLLQALKQNGCFFLAG